MERLHLKIGDTLTKHGISGVKVILFDTHGECVGRGACPGSLADPLKYLSPTIANSGGDFPPPLLIHRPTGTMSNQPLPSMTAYAREHQEIFAPMRRLYGMAREIPIAHDVGLRLGV